MPTRGWLSTVWLGTVFGLVHGAVPAEAREASGTAVAVIQATNAVGPEGARPLATQGPVFMNDRIVTNPSGEAQIVFNDSTRLVVGPNSSMAIDDYVVRGKKNTVVSAFTGAFRFVGGAGGRENVAIRTPTATIGIRGTKFDFAVGFDGGTSLAMIEGAAQMCDRTRRCVTLSGGCSMAVVPPGGGVQPVTSEQQRTQILRASFPYVRSQTGLRQDFRIDVGLCGNLGLGPATPGGAPAVPVIVVPPSAPAFVAPPTPPTVTAVAPPTVTPPTIAAPTIAAPVTTAPTVATVPSVSPPALGNPGGQGPQGNAFGVVPGNLAPGLGGSLPPGLARK